MLRNHGDKCGRALGEGVKACICTCKREARGGLGKSIPGRSKLYPIPVALSLASEGITDFADNGQILTFRRNSLRPPIRRGSRHAWYLILLTTIIQPQNKVPSGERVGETPRGVNEITEYLSARLWNGEPSPRPLSPHLVAKSPIDHTSCQVCQTLFQLDQFYPSLSTLCPPATLTCGVCVMEDS